MGFSMRRAYGTEASEIFDLYERAIANMHRNGIYQWDDTYPAFSDIIADIDADQLYIALLDGALAAAVAINRSADVEYENGAWEERSGMYCVVHRLCVEPNLQRMGVGRRMMHTIEAGAVEAGLRSVRLDTFSKNPYALALYRSLGYREVGKIYWPKGEYIMFEKLLTR